MATPRARLSLRAKATLLTVLVIAATVAAVGWAAIRQMNRLIADSQAHEPQARAQGLGGASELPLAVQDTAELDRLARRFAGGRDVLFLAISDGDGRIVASAHA